METIYAIIKDNKVVNCIVAKDWHEGVNITDINPRPGIGWLYDGEGFTPPEPTDIPSPPPEPISKLEFLRRFTMEERIAARQSNDPIIQDGQELLALAEFISLEDKDTIAYVNYLEHLGILKEGRASVILVKE